GTMMEGKSIRDKVNNYISTITAFPDETFGLAFCDLSTGESKVTLITEGWTDCINELATIQTKEIVLDENFPTEFSKELKERLSVTISYENEINISDNFEAIIAPLSQNKLIQTAARLLNYLYRTQKRSLDHMQPIETYQIRQYMKMDYYSKRNLELTETIRTKGKKGSLLWLLDETKTAMGGRLLKQWIDRPLISQEKIESRLHIVEQLKENFFERQELREKLTKVYDIERLAGKVAFGNVNARDLVNLKTTLYQIPDLMDTLSNIKDEKIQQLAGTLDPCSEIADLIERSIVDHPPISIKEGNMIRDGYHEQLDMYRDASRNGKTWIAELEKAEREKTGIKSLKIGFNRVFGYYIEVTKANLHLLPKDRNYERKQTLTNAERFITPELKEKESMILEAEEKSVDLEYELFLEIRNQVKEFIPRLQTLAKKLSEIDCLQCFAEISENRKYTKPVFNKKGRSEER